MAFIKFRMLSIVVNIVRETMPVEFYAVFRIRIGSWISFGLWIRIPNPGRQKRPTKKGCFKSWISFFGGLEA